MSSLSILIPLSSQLTKRPNLRRTPKAHRLEFPPSRPEHKLRPPKVRQQQQSRALHRLRPAAVPQRQHHQQQRQSRPQLQVVRRLRGEQQSRQQQRHQRGRGLRAPPKQIRDRAAAADGFDEGRDAAAAAATAAGVQSRRESDVPEDEHVRAAGAPQSEHRVQAVAAAADDEGGFYDGQPAARRENNRRQRD